MFTSNEINEEIEEENIEGIERWGWASTIFELCNEDITKIDFVCDRNIIEVLNWLSYQKEKNNLIKNKHG